MKSRWHFAGGVFVACSMLALSTLALAAPESLLPPLFDQPAPAPSPAPTANNSATPRPAPARSPARTARPSSAPAARPTQPITAAPGNRPVVQPVPGQADTAPSGGSQRPDGLDLPLDFPTLAEIEAMDDDEVDALFGLQPEFDIPPAARRAVRRVGLMSEAEGGFAPGSLASQPPALVRAALRATRGPLVSRWGHILLRRALASRLDAPRGMDPVQFAALRAGLLDRMGEGMAARALVQDVDSANYNLALATAAFSAYLMTGDLLGMCPVAQVRGDLREDAQWEMMQAVCDAYAGEERAARRRLDRALGTGEAPAIDVRLAQRYAGAAGEGRRAVNIEWDGVDELTPWRHSLARSLGVEVPEKLSNERGGAAYTLSDAIIPAVPLLQRITVADAAAMRGLLSSSAMVDLYAQAYASSELEADEKQDAQSLRAAYVAREPGERMAAMRRLWEGDSRYARQVLTAYAAARLPVSEALAADMPGIIASMLAAGLDRNAVRWAGVVDRGSPAWGLIQFAQPVGSGTVRSGDLDSYVEADQSVGKLRSQFLLAGLAGLGRIDPGTARGYTGEFGIDLNRASPWSIRIDRAGELGNGALVALLAGVGMQGTGWEQMTARHLFHIVRALDRSGLNAEARMIAAEAVARA